MCYNTIRIIHIQPVYSRSEVIHLLTEERHARILDALDTRGVLTLAELCELLDTSESTVRRDLSILAGKGRLQRVRGGAMTIRDQVSAGEQDMAAKQQLFLEEKTRIARYAASLIEDGDFVFLDAGSTTEKMIPYIREGSITFVTNAFLHARLLADRGFKVFIPSGEIKMTTEAIVGAECVNSILRYNFTRSFLGANGISVTGGISTPDRNEASVKEAVIRCSKQCFVLADHSKFDQISTVKFASPGRVQIITDGRTDPKFHQVFKIKEVLS